MFILKGEKLSGKDFICEVIISFSLSDNNTLKILHIQTILSTTNCLNSPMVGINL